MPTAVLISQSAADALCCLGLGLVVACLYDGIRFVAGNSKGIIFALDIVFFAIAGVLICSYAAARSYAGVVRWYHLLGMFTGAVAYYKAFFGFTEWIRKKIVVCVRLCFVPFRWICAKILKIIKVFLNKYNMRKKKRTKKQKKNLKPCTKQLQSNGKVLYNSN